MEILFVDLKAQYASIKKEIDVVIHATLDEAWFVGGPRVVAFEKGFAAAIGAKHCVGVGNGTDAIILALKALGIGIGDEVIVPANSFIATSEAVTAVGARAVFVDCDPIYYGIDPALIESAITPKTKAIIPVHLYGQPAPMDEILAIARKHNLKIIEDSAQAHLAKYRGRTVGTFGDVATYSFYPSKNLGAYGDGGAIVTNDDAVALKCRMLSNHGSLEKYTHPMEGYNSRLDVVQAAILSVKLKHLPEWNRQRCAHAALYRELLADIPQITLPTVRAETEPTYHIFVIRAQNRDDLQNHLNDHNIQTGIHYPIGLPYLEAYTHLGKNRPEDFPVTYLLQNEILSLPMYAELTDEMIREVCEHIKSFYT